MFPLVRTHRLQNTWEVLELCLVLGVVGSLPLVVEGSLPLVVVGHLLEDNSLPLVAEGSLPHLEDNSLPLVANSFLRYPLPQDNLLQSLRSPHLHL